jgi:oligogalacturonide transport system substrate-binding protein
LVTGRLVGLPTSYTALVFLWNKSTFDKAGLPIPKTWDQLMEAGRVFKAKLGDEAYPIASESYGLLMMGHAYIQQKTGRPYVYSNQAKVALSHDELKEWVEFVDALLANHVAMTPQEKASRQLGSKAVEQISEWSNGKWAGNYTWDSTLKLRQSAWNVGTQGELGSFLLVPAARSSGMYGRPSTMLSVSKNTKNPELAAKFVNFLTTDPEAAKLLGTSRGTPMAKTQLDVLQKGNLIQGMELKSYNQIVANKLEYPSPLFEHPRMQEFVTKVFDAHQKRTITADQAATQLLNEGNQILKAIK